MSAKKDLSKNGYSLHHVKMEMNAISNFVERDAVELSTVGVKVDVPAVLKAKALELENLKTHDFWTAKKKVITYERNAAKNLVKNEIYMIREQVSEVVNTETGFFNALFDKRFSSANIGEFIKMADSVYAALVENAEFLGLQGVTEQQIADFKVLIEELKTLEKSKFNAEKHLKTITSDRNEAIHAAFVYLKRIAGLGKAYWRYRNPARSAEYSINRPSRAKQSASDSDS